MSIGELKNEHDLKVWMREHQQPLNGHEVKGLLATEEWIAPTFQNSWVNFGSPWEEAGYMKDRQGFVHLQGMVKSGTNSTTIFTVPVGYRPAADHIFVVVGFGAMYGLTVQSDGDVVAPAHNALITLSGCYWKAA